MLATMLKCYRTLLICKFRLYLDRLTLGALVMAWYLATNKGLVNAFLERWHQETSFFHLHVGEMIITLDDVSCFLHFLVNTRPIDHVPLLFDKEAMKILLMSHLGYSDKGFYNEKCKCQGDVDVARIP